MSRVMLTLLLLAGVPYPVPANEGAWLRSPALSPDGSRIAFRHRGDLWLVAAAGGEARPLVAGPHFEGQPVWSADGDWIAFASDRAGNLDVYVVASAGGEPRRLTYHSSDDLPSAFSADGREVIFSSVRHDTTLPLRYPSKDMPGIYRVAVTGGFAHPFLGAPAEQAKPATDAKRWLYAERKGGEMEWRKHERSPAAWDLWLYDSSQGRHRRLTEGDWQRREPVWSSAEDAVYYLSERDGTFNVWQMPLEGESAARQITRHADHPVRSLSVSRGGDVCYGHDGHIYVLRAGADTSRKVEVSFPQAAAAGVAAGPEEPKLPITEFALAPEGGRMAFIVRGEVFLADARGRNVRRITTTPAAEAGITFAPDGRTLAFASERDGRWQVYTVELGSGGAPLGAERRLFETHAPSWLPRFSPDGQHLAYVRDGGLAVRDLRGATSRTLLPRHGVFTRVNTQGYDIRWHPDGGHIAFEVMDPSRPGAKAGYMSLASGEITIVSRNAYPNSLPRWSPSGHWMAWVSESQGLRDYGGVASGAAVFAAPLRPRAAAELAALVSTERAARDEALKAWSHDGATGPLRPPVQPEDRYALTKLSASEDGVQVQVFDISPQGDAVAWVTKTSQGLEVSRRRAGHAVERLATLEGDEVRQMQITADGRSVLLLVDGSIHAVTAGTKARKLLSRRVVLTDGAAERAAAVTQVGNFAIQAFYKKDMDRPAWLRHVARYRELAPEAATAREFRELLSELVGELDASHTGAYVWPEPEQPEETGALGAVLEPLARGDGLRIAFVSPGSPLSAGPHPVSAGFRLLSVDGHALSAGEDPARWLNGKPGKAVQMEVAAEDGSSRRTLSVKPLSQVDSEDRFYRAWVQERKEKVRHASGGKVAYSHLAWMENDNFRDLYNDSLGEAGAQALVVDTRHNGGGWLHESMLPFLQGRPFFSLGTQGRFRSAHPEHAWTGRSVMLVNSANYSNASEIPRLYQELGIGKLVGRPIPGTGLGGAGMPLVNGVEVGIANDACYDARGLPFEGAVIHPDVVVEETPEDRAAGRDPQLERALELLRSADR
jgi:tricorn protease